MEDIVKMKIRIQIQTQKEGEDGSHRAEIWSGDMEILDHKEYLTLISIIGEGELHPICQVPFAKGIGHYIWVPPDIESDV